MRSFQRTGPLEVAVADETSAKAWELLVEVRRLGLRTPTEAAAVVRATRDGLASPYS